MKIKHPEFIQRIEGWAAPIIFVFERGLWKKPTEAQLAEYERNAKIVEQHGGMMLCRRDECAGKNPPYTPQDVDAAMAAVRAANPKLDVYKHWNGAGWYGISVGARRRRAKAKKRRVAGEAK